MEKTLNQILSEIEEIEEEKRELENFLKALDRKKREKRIKRELIKILKEKERVEREKKGLKFAISELEREIFEIKGEKEKVISALEKEEKLEPENLLEKRRWQRKRWRLEDKKRNLEKKELEIEAKKIPLEKKLRKISERVENYLDPRIEEFQKKIKEIKELEREIKIELISLERELDEKKEEKKRIVRERKETFLKALRLYREGKLQESLEALREILGEKIEKRKLPSFAQKLIKIFRGPSLGEKAERLFERVKYEIEKEKEREREERKFRELLEELREKEEEEKRKLREYYEERLREQERRFQQEQAQLRVQLKKREEEFEKRLKEILERKTEKEEEEKRKEEELERLKEELRKEEEKLREEYEKRLETYFQELEKIKSKEIPKKVEREMKIYPEKIEIVSKPELLKRKEEIIEREKERLKEEEEELERKEKELETLELTPREREEREERIKILRERIIQERERLEKEKIKTEKDKKELKREKEEILKDLFSQVLTYYRERNLKKAKELSLLIKEEAQEAKNQGIFEDLQKIPIYQRVTEFLANLEKEIEKEKRLKLKPLPKREKIRPAKKLSLKEGINFLKSKLSEFWRKILPFHPPILALDISDYSCELIQLSRQKKILTFGRVIFEPKTIVEGKIANQKAFTHSLKELFKKANLPSFEPKKARFFPAIVSLPEAQTFLETFILEGKEDLYSRVKELAEQTLPLSLEEIYWNFLEHYEKEKDRTYILFAGVPREVLEEEIYALKTNGIEPIVFEPEATSIARTLLPENIQEKEGIMILDIGAKVTTLNIYNEEGFIELSATISIGGISFAERISQELKIPKEKAKKILEEGFQSKEIGIYLILAKEGEKIVEEVKRAIDYYQRETGKKIERIILTGGAALVPGIKEFFQKYFEKIEIEIGSPFRKIKKRKDIGEKEALFYTNVLGLALRGILKDPVQEGINLLPKEVQRRAREFLLAKQRKRLMIFKITLGIILFFTLALALYIIFFLL